MELSREEEIALREFLGKLEFDYMENLQLENKNVDAIYKLYFRITSKILEQKGLYGLWQHNGTTEGKMKCENCGAEAHNGAITHRLWGCQEVESVENIFSKKIKSEKERGLKTWVVTALDDGGNWFKERYVAHQLKVQSEGGGPACLVFYTDGCVSAAVCDWLKVRIK